MTTAQLPNCWLTLQSTALRICEREPNLLLQIIFQYSLNSIILISTFLQIMRRSLKPHQNPSKLSLELLVPFIPGISRWNLENHSVNLNVIHSTHWHRVFILLIRSHFPLFGHSLVWLLAVWIWLYKHSFLQHLFVSLSHHPSNYELNEND